MIRKQLVIGALYLFLLPSCTDRNSTNEVLAEANKVHLESVAMHDQVEKEINKKKKIAIERNSAAHLVKLDSLHKLVDLWEEGTVEVPGFEHEHHHESGKEHHQHKNAPQMTDESMLEYQRNTKEAIQELQKYLNDLEIR